MTAHQKALSGLHQCCSASSRWQSISRNTIGNPRLFATSSKTLQDLEATTGATPEDIPPPPISSKSLPNPNYVSSPRTERRLMRHGIRPVGSRRRRAVIASLGENPIPFEQLPYQAFQEARKILQADREEKLQKIEEQRKRLEEIKARPADGGNAQSFRQRQIVSMEQHIEKLKILADINDPMVKKRFEDGEADLNKPIYRLLAKKKWESRNRLMTIQRVEQFNLVPDLLMSLDVTADVSFSYGGKWPEPGVFVPSTESEQAPPQLKVQVFDEGERTVSIAVVDADVPNVSDDSFRYRCHFLASNIKISPTSTLIDLPKLHSKSQIITPWLAPWAQKGSPYHRLTIWVMEHAPGQTIDVEAAAEKYGSTARDTFVLRSFVDKFKLKPFGVTLFRTQWDEGMDQVMGRLGVPEAEMELRRKRVEPLPYKWKPRMSERYR